jgi:hypothetical protein
MGITARLASTVCGAILATATATSAADGGLVEYAFDAADFSTPLTIDNPYWPLVPGTRVVYSEVSEDECVINEFLVTDASKSDFTGVYAALSARVIADREWLDEDCDGGRDLLLEDTFDWYAQDDAGNIWYFGEDTTEFLYDDDGNPIGSSKEGSWQAGDDGAVAGLIMLAEPSPGAFYQQEFYEDVAEDMGKVVGVDRPVSIGLGEFDGCLVTKEWSPLEVGAVEHKHYCPPFGLVLIEGMGGGRRTSTEAIEIDLP